jgi:hypothetical protein
LYAVKGLFGIGGISSSFSSSGSLADMVAIFNAVVLWQIVAGMLLVV